MKQDNEEYTLEKYHKEFRDHFEFLMEKYGKKDAESCISLVISLICKELLELKAKINEKNGN